jgi:hypothetical protein
MNEFQTEEAQIADRFLAKNLGRDWRSFVWNQARRGWGRRRDRHLYKLFILQQMRRRDASTSGTDVQRLGQLNKLNSKGVGTSQKHGNLDANTLALPLVGEGHGCRVL